MVAIFATDTALAALVMVVVIVLFAIGGIVQAVIVAKAEHRHDVADRRDHGHTWR